MYELRKLNAKTLGESLTAIAYKLSYNFFYFVTCFCNFAQKKKFVTFFINYMVDLQKKG